MERSSKIKKAHIEALSNDTRNAVHKFLVTIKQKSFTFGHGF